MIAVCAVAAGALAGFLVVPTRGAPGPYSFGHKYHLTAATVAAAVREATLVQAGKPRPGGGGDVDADCRSCHDYGNVGPNHHLDRRASCDKCHGDDQHLLVTLRSAAADDRKPFPHAEHLRDESITCFTCHRIIENRGWIDFTVPADGLGKRGRAGRPGGEFGDATCADCHAAHQPVGGLVKQDETTGDGRKCADCHMGADAILPLAARPGPPATGQRPFLHADHGGAAGTCLDCHAGITSSRTIWDYDPTAGTAGKCRDCHVADATGTPLIGPDEKSRTTKLPFVDFSNFPHGAHLEPAGRVETSGVRKPTCTTCHFPDSSSKEPVGRGDLVDYTDCVTCHDTWSVKNHGVGAWACFKCHGGEVDSAGKLPIGKADVKRANVVGVQFATHHHPGMTRKGARLAQPTEKCLDCHVAGIESITSRLRARPFVHEPHVPELPSDENCLACHSSVATTRWSEDLKHFDPHLAGGPAPVGLAAHSRGCLECHVGATPEQLGVRFIGRQVPQFDHAAHVKDADWKPGRRGIGCTECHEKGGDAGYLTPADVTSCTRCHSHDTRQKDKYARTGPSASPADAAACKFCHATVHAENGGVVRGPRHQVRERHHLRLLDGKQWHDKGGDCAACHGRDPVPGKPAWKVRERIEKARIVKSIHRDKAFANFWFNDPRIQETPDAEGRTCATCHRSVPDGYLQSLGPR